MLDRIHVKNFKANRDIDLRLAPLTVLSGINSSGKSTLLQALGILKQSYIADNRTGVLQLIGELLQLGQYRDVLSEDSDTDAISISILEDEKTYDWVFRGERDANELPFDKEPLELPNFITGPDFQYLQADRIIPRTLYPQASHRAKTTGFLGPRGEFTVGVLAAAAEKAVSRNRVSPRSGIGLDPELWDKVAPTEGLLDQVAGWLQHLSPGTRLTPKVLVGTDEVLLQFSYAGRARETVSNSYRPTNVGFGLTYSLPIIVSCLAAPKGALLLIENPEAHLHPRGQSMLGELICRSVIDGVQVILETHSDHLLNGIRLAVKRQLIQSSAMVLHFFQRDLKTGHAFVQSPAVLDNGRLSNWPDGFFDQWDKDVEALLD